jgi:hypothetical protein
MTKGVGRVLPPVIFRRLSEIKENPEWPLKRALNCVLRLWLA